MRAAVEHEVSVLPPNSLPFLMHPRWTQDSVQITVPSATPPCLLAATPPTVVSTLAPPRRIATSAGHAGDGPAGAETMGGYSRHQAECHYSADKPTLPQAGGPVGRRPGSPAPIVLSA